MASVLLVEDDHHIRASLARGLSEAGHSVRTESSGAAALTAVVDWTPDVIVLDLGLPDIDGREVLGMLRGVVSIPVIIATARDDEAEIIELLDSGADDHVVKPFSAAQIEARIRAVLRRQGAGGQPEEAFQLEGLEIHFGQRTVAVDFEDVELSRLEFELLAALARNSPNVVTRRDLLAQVWNQPYGGSEKTLDVHLSWLRRKLGETAASPRFLHTVRGVGVKLDTNQG